jgi:hypothetical protein
MMRRARARRIAVVFHLHNFGDSDCRGFTNISAIIFPSEYSRRHYRQIGLDGTVITDPIPLERCTPTSAAIPTAHEVAPWVATIERLRDDPDFEAEHRALAKAEASRWETDRLGVEYERLVKACKHGY